MTTIRCARCGLAESAEGAAYDGDGVICARCHRRLLEADAMEMRRQHDPQHRDDPFVIWAPVEEELPWGPRYAQATLDGALGTLAGRGLTPQREAVGTTLDAHGGARPASGYRETWVIPRVTLAAGGGAHGYRTAPTTAGVTMRATFWGEDFTDRVVKLFRSEIQTGDEVFDRTVYVRTDTPDVTAALLARSDLRDRIGDVIANNGRLSVDGCTVKGEAMWLDVDPGPHPQDLIARVVLALLDG